MKGWQQMSLSGGGTAVLEPGTYRIRKLPAQSSYTFGYFKYLDLLGVSSADIVADIFSVRERTNVTCPNLTGYVVEYNKTMYPTLTTLVFQQDYTSGSNITLSFACDNLTFWLEGSSVPIYDGAGWFEYTVPADGAYHIALKRYI